ncbi:hypothetical protein D3C87_1530070 [compost metagenome]
MAKLPGSIPPAVARELEVFFALWSPTQAGAGAIFVRQRDCVRASWHTIIRQHSEDIRVIIEVLYLNGHKDSTFFIEFFKPVPEVAERQLSSAVWQRRVKYQTEAIEQVRLPNPVLAHDDDVASQRDIQASEVPEVIYCNP